MASYLEIARAVLKPVSQELSYEINEITPFGLIQPAPSSLPGATKETKETKKAPASDGWDWIAAQLAQEGLQLVDVDVVLSTNTVPTRR